MKHIVPRLSTVQTACFTWQILARLDKVAVLPFAGVIAGVGILSNGRHAAHGNVARQQEIEFVDQLHRIVDNLSAVEVRHVIGRINPRIGTPGARQGDGFAQQGSKRPFERLLHGGHVGLTLPTEIGSSVVPEFEEITHVVKISAHKYTKNFLRYNFPASFPIWAYDNTRRRV